MDDLLYLLARSVVALFQSLPLRWAARLGRVSGALAYWLDRRHRRVALGNLTLCFGGEMAPGQIRALAAENFRRIGESFACSLKTAAMTFEELQPHIEFVGDPKVLLAPADPKPQSIIAAIGHFGNFELYVRFGQYARAYRCGTTYRGLRQPSLNRLLLSLRQRSGCVFFERRFDAFALKTFMNQPGVLLGLLADQHAGDGGLRLPFLGHECSTSAAPAIFALRYRCALYTGICYRVDLARWRIEAGSEIPTRENGIARSIEAIMTDVNRVFEAAVRRDPANWFWVHNRWKVQRTKAAIRGQKSEVGGQHGEKGGGGQRSEVGGQTTEIRSQGSEPRSQKSEGEGGEPNASFPPAKLEEGG